MKRNRALALAAAIIAVANLSSADDKTNGSSKPAANPPGLSLVIRCTAGVLKEGDEIPIEFIISNHGTEDYKYDDRNYDRGGRLIDYKLVAKTASGESVPDPRLHIQPGKVGGGLPAPRVLHPGDSLTKIIPLNLWALIKEAGRYEVAGICEDPPGHAISDPISLAVLPRTKEERQDYIKDLTNQIAAQLAVGMADQGLVMKLMYTCSAESVPMFLGILRQPSSGPLARF